uniref:Uncharacterized protein n=1 Tax=Arundo donax TaxID=35708 RepID=A0A0A8YAZ8_ARUDO
MSHSFWIWRRSWSVRMLLLLLLMMMMMRS